MWTLQVGLFSVELAHRSLLLFSLMIHSDGELNEKNSRSRESTKVGLCVQVARTEKVAESLVESL